MISVGVFGQKITRVELLQSESFVGMKRNGENANKVIKPVFQQDNSTLTCDSAYFYIEKNSFDAFGHVHINQADTINIFSDLLNYNGNTKIAILTNNVRMVDRTSVLTTNNLVYNMASKVGEYKNGGKIVNGANTLTSKSGFYFSNSSDAYFRYDVRVKTPEVLILSDTLRYNSVSKIAYFYGPTNIYSKDDTLYTENGTYNTATDQAAFGKNNLYRQNTKTLTGDSLFYDRVAGYGKAVKNIIFRDTAQKVELHGDLGYYLKKDESIEVTKNAYVVFETEKDSLSKDSTYLAADTLYSSVTTKGELYKLREKRNAANITPPPLEKELVDSLKKDVGEVQDSLSFKKDSLNQQNTLATDSLEQNLSADSVQMSTDSLSTVIAKEKPPIELSKKEQRKLKKSAKKKEKQLAVTAVAGKNETEKEKIPKKVPPGLADSLEIAALNRKLFVSDSLRKDSIQLLRADTAKVRVISAWRNVKVFKSDLQSKSDSAFFSYGDSTLRLYKAPIVWSQGSQIVADTMYMQMVKGKMDNMDMIRNAIVVSTNKDSVNFNQVAGKNMKGYFVNEKLDRIFVDGNAESIYFPEDTTNQGMIRTLAARMRINFSNDSLMSILFLRKPEMTYYPIGQLTEELKTLPNFSWKPKERPRSKEELIAKPKAVVNNKNKTPVKTKEKPQPKAAPKPQLTVPKKETDSGKSNEG